MTRTWTLTVKDPNEKASVEEVVQSLVARGKELGITVHVDVKRSGPAKKPAPPAEPAEPDQVDEGDDAGDESRDVTIADVRKAPPPKPKTSRGRVG